MYQEPIKGPSTKLLQCEAIVIRCNNQDPEIEKPEFEVYASDRRGNILQNVSFLRAVETTEVSESLIQKVFGASKKQEFSLRVFHLDQKGKAIEETPFFDIIKEKDLRSNLYQVIGRERVDAEKIGTIDYQLKSCSVQFEIEGSESAYLVDDGKPQGSALESLVCCMFGTKFYNSELLIYDNDVDKKSFSVKHSIRDAMSVPSSKLREPIGKILKLKKRDPFSQYRDVFLSFPKSAYDEERMLLLALAFLLSARLFAK